MLLLGAFMARSPSGVASAPRGAGHGVPTPLLLVKEGGHAAAFRSYVLFARFDYRTRVAYFYGGAVTKSWRRRLVFAAGGMVSQPSLEMSRHWVMWVDGYGTASPDRNAVIH